MSQSSLKWNVSLTKARLIVILCYNLSQSSLKWNVSLTHWGVAVVEKRTAVAVLTKMECLSD